MQVTSPDTDVFSTPPTTPATLPNDLRPSLARRTSRPSSLCIQQSPHTYASNIVLDQQASPVVSKAQSAPVPNGNHTAGLAPSMGIPTPLTHSSGALSSAQSHSQSGRPHHPHLSPNIAASPYFVHSQLQGATFQDYLQAKKNKAIHDARMDHHHRPHPPPYSDGTASEPYSARSSDYDDEEDYAGSLTRQLAETAVGVREMSKQLGRTRVHSHIQTVLIVTKARDNRLIKLTRELALYLMLKKSYNGRGMVVYVDSQLKTSRRFDAAGIEHEHPELFAPFPSRRSSSSSVLSNGSNDHSRPTGEGQLRYWTAEMCSRSPHLFDFVVTLGGDGTVLFTSWLFQRVVPPVLPFALGSLGFLTNFDFADHQSVMDGVIDNGIRVNLRMRFTCTVYRAVTAEEGKKRRAVKKGDTGEILMKNLEKSGWEALENGSAPIPIQDGSGKCGKDKEIMCFTTRPVESFEVLNDLVVDRGPSPYVSLLELFGDEHHLTTVQADGLTVATPTGSTAYSLSAGGSLVHPEIPAILITPICPHTLSFRPMLLPDSMELRICVPFNSRSTAWASFDGRGRVELKQGDHIKVTASRYPFPTVCADTQSTDWFNSISRTLKWNERERQKSFVVVEESPSRKGYKHRKPSVASSNGDVLVASHPGSPFSKGEEQPLAEAEAEDENECSDDEEDDEENEKYDIDDLSSTESPPGMEAALAENRVTPEEEKLGREKAFEAARGWAGPSVQDKAEDAARVLTAGNPFMQAIAASRSGLHSGVETPDRFAGPHPHPPKISPRHVQFVSNGSSSSSLASLAMDRDVTLTGRRPRGEANGQSKRSGQSRSRTPRTRESDLETLKTPRPVDDRRRRSRSRSRDRAHDSHVRRVLAVWGQDESDSAASDSDV